MSLTKKLGKLAISGRALTALAFNNLSPLEGHDAVVYNTNILDVRTAVEFIWVAHQNVNNVINISYKIV